MLYNPGRLWLAFRKAKGNILLFEKWPSRYTKSITRSNHPLLISAFICFIFRMFCSTFLGIYRLNVMIYTPIPVLCLGIVLWWYLQDFRPFDPAIDPHLSAYWPTTEVPQALYPWSRRRAEEFGTSQVHGQPVVSPMDRGELITATLFIFLLCLVEDAHFCCLKQCVLRLLKESSAKKSHLTSTLTSLLVRIYFSLV